MDTAVSTLSLLPVQLLTPESYVSVSILVDSGSSGNFISQALLTRLNLPRKRQPREIRVETIQGKPLGRGRVNYRAPPLTLRVGCLHKETISFLVLEGPTVDIILDAPGSTNILQKSDGILVRSLAGARPVSRTVWSRSLCQSRDLRKPKCVQPPPKVLSLWRSIHSHLTTRRSRMWSASRQPLASHRIGHGTVPSTCCLELNSPRVEFTLCPSRSARQWRLHQGGSPTRIHPAIYITRCLKLCGQKGQRFEALYQLPIFEFTDSEAALSTSPGTSYPQGTPWGPQPSLTCRARITSFASGRAMSGRRYSSHPQVTTNIGS